MGAVGLSPPLKIRHKVFGVPQNGDIQLRMPSERCVHTDEEWQKASGAPSTQSPAQTAEQ